MKRIEVQWNELVDGNTYWVTCVGEKWNSDYSGYHVFKNNRLCNDKEDGYFEQEVTVGREFRIFKEVKESKKLMSWLKIFNK